VPDWMGVVLGGSAVSALIAAVAAIFRLLLRSAIDAERRRADEWHEAWRIERQISATATGQVTRMVDKVERVADEEAHR
jgi:hypothetical protein